MLSSVSYAIYNDEGNDSCLVIYSDNQVYRPNNLSKPNTIEIYLTIENKCKNEMQINLGLLTETKHTEQISIIDTKIEQEKVFEKKF